MTLEAAPDSPRVRRYSSATLAAPPAAVFRALQLAWQRPSVLVALTVCLIGVPPGDGAEAGGLNITPADLSAALLVPVAVLHHLRARTRPSLSGPIVVGVAAPMAAWLIATVTATDPSHALLGLVRNFELLVAVPIAVALSLRSQRDVIVVAIAVLGVAVFEGAVGTYQYVTGTGAGFGEVSVRAVGTFGAYDILSMASVVSFGLLVALAVALGGHGPLRRGAIGAALVLALPLALSLSRGAWIATSVAALIMVAFSGWRSVAVTIGVVGLVAFVSAGIQPDFGVLGSRAGSVVTSAESPDRSVTDRYDLWGTAFQMWEYNPVTGVGLKGFALWRDSYAPLSLSSGSDISDPQGGFRRVELLSPHNYYLLIASEQGVLGLTAFAWLLIALVVGAFRRARTARPGTLERVVGLFAVGFVIHFMVASIWGDLSGLLTSVLLGVVVGYASGLKPAAHRGGQLPSASSSSAG
ncbi:MAG: O-antigen ligase family protein [Gaiellaceae bacterium]